MTRRGAVLFAAAVVLVLAAIGLGRPERAPAEPDVVPTVAAREDTPPAIEAPAPAAPVALPLPPGGTPLPQIVDTLKARADAGDSRAACRLAVELLRCTHLSQVSPHPAGSPHPDVMLADRGYHRAADRFAEAEIRKIHLMQQCQAVDDALIRQAPRYLAAAARAGEPEAMLRYAKGEHHGVGGLGFAADPDLDRWRRESPEMLLRAARSGQPEAVRLLGYVYRSDGRPFAGLVADDPVASRAWTLLERRLHGQAANPERSLGAAEESQAAALAKQWHQQYFNNAPPAAIVPGVRLSTLEAPFQPLERDRFCE